MTRSTGDKPRRRVQKPTTAERERNLFEEALRVSEEKYRTLTENITVGIFRSTPGARGKFLEANPALVHMLGYESKDELFAVDVAQIYVHPEDRKVFSDKISRTGFLKNEELLLRRKDGSPIIVSETAIAVQGRNGKILYFDGIVEDITERKESEEALRIQKTYLEILFNSAPEAIVLHDNEDRVVNVNEEFVRMFGYSRDEAIGKPINELVAPDSRRDEASHFSNAVIHGARVEAESQRRRKDGTLIDVSILGSPIIDQGRQMGVYAIYRDITERKRAQEDLRLQKTYFERLFNSAPEAIALHDNDDRIVNINEEFSRMFGYGPGEVVGKPINDLIASKEILKEAELVSQKVLRGERVELDTQRMRKDGTLIHVSILGAPILYDGKQIGDYAIYRDITERKKAQEELRVQISYFERLFNSAPEAIVLHDNEDRVVNVNHEFTGLFGYSREEAIGKPINSLVAPEDFQEEAGRFSHMVIHGERVEADSVRRRKDGSLIDVWILGAPIMHGGKQIGVYAIYRDITERKRAAEARIRAAEEARMARNIQLRFLPESNPRLPGYEIAGKSIPALNVGGDYYDFIELDEHRLAIGLGDVSGNGLPAALVMANLQAAIRALALFEPDPDHCLRRANTLIYRSTDSRTFISLFYGILNTRDNTFTYANAGHTKPIVVAASERHLILQKHGLALGLTEDASYEKEEVKLNPGDTLLIYSDGILDAMDEHLEQFGEERLLHLLLGSRGESGITLLEKIFRTVNSHAGTHPANDDMTAIAVKRV
jgi:PAS domain S-box-containing protein